MITEERSFCVTQLLASRAERYKFGWAEWRGTHPLKAQRVGQPSCGGAKGWANLPFFYVTAADGWPTLMHKLVRPAHETISEDSVAFVGSQTHSETGRISRHR